MVSPPLGVVLGVFGCEYAVVDLRFLCVIQQRSVEVLNHSIGGHDSGLQEEPYPSARNKQRKKVSRKMSLNMWICLRLLHPNCHSYPFTFFPSPSLSLPIPVPVPVPCSLSLFPFSVSCFLFSVSVPCPLSPVPCPPSPVPCSLPVPVPDIFLFGHFTER